METLQTAEVNRDEENETLENIALGNIKPSVFSSDLMQRTVGLEISTGMIGTLRKVPSSRVEVKDQDATEKTDEGSLKVAKEILDSKNLGEMRSIRGLLARQLQGMSLESSMFGSGRYLLSVKVVEEVQAALEEFQPKFQALVDAFVEEYPQLVADAKVRLGTLFSPLDYPPVEQVRDAFRFEYRFFMFDTPAALREVSESLFEEERKKSQAKWAQAGEEIHAALREEFASLVENLAEKLAPSPDGSKKVLKEATVDNLWQFLESYEKRSPVKDEQLQGWINDTREILKGKTAKDIRENFRERVAEGFKTVKAQIDVNVVRRVRKISVKGAKPTEEAAPESSNGNGADLIVTE